MTPSPSHEPDSVGYPSVFPTFVFVCFAFLVSVLPACTRGTARGGQGLTLRSLGCPTLGVPPEARAIRDIRHFDEQLFLGHGDYMLNTGPTAVLTYDPRAQSFAGGSVVDEEAITRFVILDDTLVIPGIDASEDDHFANVYIREDDAFTKHRTLPNTFHVFDAVSFRGSWYVATGSWEGENLERLPAGRVFRSIDRGKTWEVAYSFGGQSKNVVARMRELAVFRDRLYAFPCALVNARRFNNFTLDYVPDAFGPPETLVFDGESWTPADILPPGVSRVERALAFRDHLIIVASSGRDVTTVENRSRGFIFDGESTRPLPHEIGNILDVELCEDELLVLARRNEQAALWTTNDLADWAFFDVPRLVEPTSVWRQDGSTYLGARDGNLYVSEPTPSGSDTTDAPPFSVTAGGVLAREARSAWLAIDRWAQPGELATLRAEANARDRIDLQSSNVNSFTIFLAESPLRDADRISLRVDGTTVYQGPAPSSACRCTRETASWKVEFDSLATDSWEPNPPSLGVLDTPLRHTLQADSPLAVWIAQAFRVAASTDIALVPNDTLRFESLPERVTLDTLDALHQRCALVTFRATGSELIAALRFNCAKPIVYGVQVAGFTLRRTPARNGKREFISTSLAKERVYTVAVSRSLAQHSDRMFGRFFRPLEDANVDTFTALRLAVAREFDAIPR